MRRRGLSPEHVQMVVAKATGKQQEEEAVSPKTKAYRTMGVGFALFACGLGVTIISALGGGGAGVVFVYPTLGGLFLMVKGLFDRMKCPPEPSSAKARLSAD